MFILAILPIISSTILFKFMALVIFIKYKNLVLGTLNLAIDSDITMNSAIYI